MLVAIVGCTSTQSDMVEPTIDPPGPIAWLEPPAPPQPPPPTPWGAYYALAAAELTLKQALRHQAVRAEPLTERDDAWITALSRLSCAVVGCGPCVAEVRIQRVHCGTGLKRPPLELWGCEPDEP